MDDAKVLGAALSRPMECFAQTAMNRRTRRSANKSTLHKQIPLCTSSLLQGQGQTSRVGRFLFPAFCQLLLGAQVAWHAAVRPWRSESAI